MAGNMEPFGKKDSFADDNSNRFRKRFLGIAFLVGLLLPPYIAVESTIRGNFWNLLPLALVELAMGTGFLVTRLMGPHATDIAASALLAFYPAAYLWGTYAPGNYQTYVFVLLLMPLIFDSLTPKPRYAWWLVYALVFVAASAFSYLGPYPSAWHRDFEPHSVLIFHLSFAAIWIMSYVVRRQVIAYVDEISGGIIRDKTTGLPTLAVYRESIQAGEDCFTAIVTISNFRELTTLFGYSIAGNIIVSAAKRLTEASASFDGRAFRLRGHDLGFTKVLGPGESARDLAMGFHRSLSGPLTLMGKEIELSYRLGYTLISDGNADKALDEAYEALGVAEREGLDIAGFDTAWRKVPEAERALADLMTLSRNLVEGTLSVYYQPVIALASGKPAWSESLARFRNSSMGFEDPSRLMALASTTGHWAAIEDFIFATSTRRACSGAGPISVNIALRDLDRPSFRDTIELGVREAREKTSGIILEILEGDFGSLNPARRSILRDLRKAGCLIAIDDFGSGYSNYSRLIAMPVDIVKFDASLVRNARRSRAETALLRSIVRFCFDIGALTVAEGLESAEQVDFILDLGFDFGQGYYWSKPLPEEEAPRAERSPLLASKLLRFDQDLG
ncbi:MAG TPA: EAL domain-containing protein [Rectinemataceae bacterium]